MRYDLTFAFQSCSLKVDTARLRASSFSFTGTESSRSSMITSASRLNALFTIFSRFAGTEIMERQRRAIFSICLHQISKSSRAGIHPTANPYGEGEGDREGDREGEGRSGEGFVSASPPSFSKGQQGEL